LSRTVLAIDIGSTKICAIIAEISDDGSIAITGAGTSKAQGLKKGSITNIELASKSIKTALNDAKRVSGSDVRTAVVSISGAYTKSLNSNGIVTKLREFYPRSRKKIQTPALIESLDNMYGLFLPKCDFRAQEYKKSYNDTSLLSKIKSCTFIKTNLYYCS